MEGETGSGWILKEKLPSNWKRIELQPRDLSLLRVLFEQKFLSWPQIRDYLFEGKERYAYLRVWKLRRFGFIRKLWAGFTEEELFLPTEFAHEYFRARFVELPTPLAFPDARTIAHDLLATDIRFLFQSIGFGSSWTSERVWRMGRSARIWVPDALIHIGGDPFALEVECVQKMDRRYEDIFSRYQSDPELSACLYVTTESLMETLLKKALGFPAVYFVSKEELFGKKEKARFRNSENRVLLIEENLESRLEAASSHGN